MTVKFLLKNPKEGLNTIHVRARYGRKVDLFLDTKQKVELADWDAENGRFCVEYKELRGDKMVTLGDVNTRDKVKRNKFKNDILENISKLIRTDFSDNPNQKFSAEWLRNLLFPPAPENPMSEMTFSEYIGIYLSSRSHELSEGTHRKFNSIKSNFMKFEASRKKPALKLSEIDNSIKIEFERFFVEVLGNKRNTFNKTFSNMKTVLLHAAKNGYEINQSIRDIRLKYDKTVFTILNQEEIQKITETEFDDEHLKTAKDWLLISCYTAARISDFMRFETSMMRLDSDAEGKPRWYLDYIQTKTKGRVTIPVDSRIIQILEKRDWSFPRSMSETRYNQHIKQVCKEAGIIEPTEGDLLLDENGNENTISKNRKSTKKKFRKVRGFYPKWKLVSSHIGRRSFASNNYGTMPTTLIMRFTGHTREQMLLNYIGRIETRIVKEMATYIN